MQARIVIKDFLKKFRWRGRRMRTALRHGRGSLQQAPIIFGNAMPKSGSHLLTQVLYGLPEVGAAVNPGFPPVNRNEANQPVPEDAMFHKIYQMRPGDIGYGYLHANEPFLSLLTQPEQATIFIYRDPRDMLVSHVFYATDLYDGHGMHAYYEQLEDVEARLNAAIKGVSTPELTLASVRKRYDAYLGWLQQSEVFALRFEDLILEQDATLARLIGFLEVRGFQLCISPDKAIDILKAGIAPQKSGTFRKGKPGNWQEHFTPQNKELFKEVAGDLLIQLGYEVGDDW